MKLNQRRKARFERRLRLAGDWKPRTADAAENAIFDRCFELAEAARELERVADAEGSAGALAASMGCATSAFESLANAMLKLRGVALRELSDASEMTSEPSDAQRLGRLLFTIDQNMRFAAQAADLARQNAAQALDEKPHAVDAVVG